MFKWMKVVPWLLCLSLWVDLGLAARILAVLPFPGKSHHIFFTSIMKGLTSRGHHVLEYSPYPPQSPLPNHTYLPLHTRFEHTLYGIDYNEFRDKIKQYHNDFYGLKLRKIWQINREVCEDTFENAGIRQLLDSDSKFDIVITESTFGQESLLVFGHHFNAHTVTLETLIPWVITNWNSGNALSISSAPDMFSYVWSDDVLMPFKVRLVNFISVALFLVTYHFHHLPFHQSLVSQHFPHPNIPSVTAMANNVSLYLTNSHPAVVNYIQPYTPNVVPVGGLHIPTATIILPQDIQLFLDNSNEGFIYFSLGTVVPMHTFPKAVIEMFTAAFTRLRQNVLWKVDLDNLGNVPINVKIVKWAPQIGVLEHPNCKLFVTHGGLFSHHEAIYAGVPTVGIPFFADQPYNLQYTVISGRGVMLDFLTLTEETFYIAVTRVLGDPRYKETALQMSRVYRDRPVTPIDSAMYWVEYILRHGGASLRPASTQLSWYQLALLDVLAVVLTALALLVASIYTVVSLTVKLTRRTVTKLKKAPAKKNE